MPKSKRNKQVTLSKTTKKGRGHKELIINGIRDAAEKYSSIYVFNFQNMRNSKLKEFREQLQSSSKFFLGSNKVMQVAIGRSSSDEIKPNLHKVSKLLRGDAGMIFTNLSKEEVERLFNEFEGYDFARTGSIATEKSHMSVLYRMPDTRSIISVGAIKVELKEGPLEQFTHDMEPFLRKQGMPVRLNKGVVELVSDFVVCEEGKPLSPEASRILRLMGNMMATFRLNLVCRWGSEDDFELYIDGPGDSDVE